MIVRAFLRVHFVSLIFLVFCVVLCFCVLYFVLCFVRRPVYCVPTVASVSGLSILDCHFGFIKCLLSINKKCTYMYYRWFVLQEMDVSLQYCIKCEMWDVKWIIFRVKHISYSMFIEDLSRWHQYNVTLEICDNISYHFMKRKFKLWWSSIQPISTKQTITSHLNWTHRTQKKHDMWPWKSRSWHGQEQKCGRIIPVNRILTLSSW